MTEPVLNNIILPEPHEDDLYQWATDLVAVLRANRAFGQTDTAGGGSGGSVTLPIQDGQGRDIVTLDGLWVYASDSSTPIAGDIVTIDTQHLVDAAITTAKISNLAVDTTKLADLSVEAAKLANSSVTETKIANLAVGTAAIQAAAVGTAQIANLAVTSALIADLAVVTAKIDDAAVNNAKIANLAVSTANIQNAAVTNAKIANLAVGTAQIQDAAITNAKIGSVAIDTAQIANGAITQAKIANLAVDNAQIADGAISVAKIGNLQVTNAKIGNGAITSVKIASASVLTAKIADLAVGTIKIANFAVSRRVAADTNTLTSRSVNTSWQTISALNLNFTTDAAGELVFDVAVTIECSVRDGDRFEVDVRIVRGTTEIARQEAFLGKGNIDISSEPQPWYGNGAASFQVNGTGSNNTYGVQVRLSTPRTGSYNAPDSWNVRAGSMVITEYVK